MGKSLPRRRKYWLQALAAVYLLWTLPAGFAGSADTAEDAREKAALTDAGTGSVQVSSEEPKPMIALTFDDGPDADSTPRLLDGLKERGVQATFFVIGANIEKDGNDALIKRMYEEGHLIGNHTYHHVDLSGLSHEAAHKELEMTDERIREITGEEPYFIRPPFGAFPDDMEEDLDRLYVKWTVDPLDWTTKDTDTVVRRVIEDTGENDIILLHDCYDSSVDAALRIVDILQEKGYEFVTADRIILE